MNFIGGRNILKTFEKLNYLQKFYGFTPLLDYAKEGTVNPKVIQENVNSIKKDIRSFDLMLNSKYKNDFLKDFSYSLKLTTFGRDPDTIFKIIKDLENLHCKTLKNIFLDAEHQKDDVENNIINKIFELNKDNKNFKIFKTYQMYRKDTFEKLKNDIQNIPNLNIKLVRGAYLDVKNPLFYNTKEDTDRSYNEAMEYLLIYKREFDYNLMLATHNDKSIEKAKDLIKKLNIDKETVLFGQLLGFNEKQSKCLSQEGYKVYKYIPYGNYSSLLPYLIRRLYENYPILLHYLNILIIFNNY